MGRSALPYCGTADLPEHSAKIDMTSSESAASRSQATSNPNVCKRISVVDLLRPRILHMHANHAKTCKGMEGSSTGAGLRDLHWAGPHLRSGGREPRESRERADSEAPRPGPWSADPRPPPAGPWPSAEAPPSRRWMALGLWPLDGLLRPWPPLEGCWRPCGAAESFRRCPKLLSGTEAIRSIFKLFLAARIPWPGLGTTPPTA